MTCWPHKNNFSSQFYTVYRRNIYYQHGQHLFLWSIQFWSKPIFIRTASNALKSVLQLFSLVPLFFAESYYYTTVQYSGQRTVGCNEERVGVSFGYEMHLGSVVLFCLISNRTLNNSSPGQFIARSTIASLLFKMVAADLKIHGTVLSTCTQRVLISAYEADIKPTIVEVNLQKGEHKQPAHLAIQPFGQIPVLSDGSFKVYESRAIARYIDLKYNGSKLLSIQDPAKYALIEQWISVEMSHFQEPTFQLAYELVFKPVYFGATTDHGAVAEQKEKLIKVLSLYDSHLKGKSYLVGDSFTLADAVHLPFCNLVFSLPEIAPILESHVNVKKWWQTISLRPSWQKVLAELKAARAAQSAQAL